MNNPIYKIEIDELTIRCAEVSDATAQKEAIDVSLDHLHEYMPWSHHEPEALHKKEERLELWRKDYLENRDYTVVVFKAKKLVACAGLHTRLAAGTLEIGYWVRADEINKGVATKVSLALTTMALRYIKVNYVEIRHHYKNIASSKVPQKLKFKRLENYIEDNIENGRRIIDQVLFKENEAYYKSLFKEMKFYDIEGNLLD